MYDLYMFEFYCNARTLPTVGTSHSVLLHSTISDMGALIQRVC